MEWACEVRGPKGSITRNFLVDTGASTNIIPISVARRLGLPKIRSQQVATANGTVSVAVVMGEISVEGCGWFTADFFAADTAVYAVGYELIGKCGLSIPAQG